MFLSEEIDEECEAIHDGKIADFLETQKDYEAEMSFIFEEDNNNMESPVEASSSVLDDLKNTSKTRSGIVIRANTSYIGLQTDIYNVTQPPVRKVKVCYEGIKFLQW